MPAKDYYHDAVKRALIKDGWMIVQEQVYLSDNYRHVWVDLRVKRETEAPLVLIEIKGFESHSSLVDALMAALGQYAVYKAMLDQGDCMKLKPEGVTKGKNRPNQHAGVWF